MKTIFAILAALVLAVSAPAQTSFTNGVKISTLTSATTPLSGSEIVPLNQSGTTKTVSVSQLLLAATSATAAASNYLAAVSGTNAAAIAAASNYLAAVISTNAASLAAVSNYLATLANAANANATVASNALWLNFTNYYPVSNPGQYQSFSSVWSIANSAAATAVSNVATNYGKAIYSIVNYGLLNLGTNNSQNVWIDLSAGSLQFVTVTNKASTYLWVTNQASGQNVTVIVRNFDNTTRTLYTPPYSQPGVIQQVNNGNSISFPANGKIDVVNLTCFGNSISNVICSESVSQ
jgi:hypothetical protein